MSTDKFGRHHSSSSKVQWARKRNLTIFPFATSDGDLNLNGKRIRFVGDPIHEEDCVNKRHMRNGIASVESQLIIHINKKLDVIRKEVEDIKSEVETRNREIEKYKRYKADT